MKANNNSFDVTGIKVDDYIVNKLNEAPTFKMDELEKLCDEQPEKSWRERYLEREEARKSRKEFMQKCKLHWGKFYVWGHIPCIEIKTPEGGSVYLSAFRNYAFQVSGTWQGENDKGATPVFGLDTFGSIVQIGRSNLSGESTKKYIIASVAMQAVQEYCLRNGYVAPDINFAGLYLAGDVEFGKFIDACYAKYCKGQVINDTVDDFDEIAAV